MLRWFERLHEAGVVDERRCDDFYAFFVICYHLKDWIKNDPRVRQEAPTVADSVVAFVDEKQSLRMSADIANGVKHLVRNNPTRVKIDPNALLSVAQPAFQADAFQEDAFQVSGEIVVKALDQKWDAEMIAGHCVAHWQNFLRRAGLLHDD
jgi:hypothetical protein